jgi:hypothetical protein
MVKLQSLKLEPDFIKDLKLSLIIIINDGIEIMRIIKGDRDLEAVFSEE